MSKISSVHRRFLGRLGVLGCSDRPKEMPLNTAAVEVVPRLMFSQQEARKRERSSRSVSSVADAVLGMASHEPYVELNGRRHPDELDNPKPVVSTKILDSTLAWPSIKRALSAAPIQNTVIHGDSRAVLDRLPEKLIHLIFTSPAYYNARPEYQSFGSYGEYLCFLENCFRQFQRILADGRFLVLNLSHVLVPRKSRGESSSRLAIPFDVHPLLVGCGFEFVDDITWMKPEGAGWATMRGCRFAADRNPLAYKTVPVTERVLVYRKESELLIDDLIKHHPDRAAVRDSKVPDGYQRTDVWCIPPSRHKVHPATFPLALARNVIQYYSIKGDVVLDPFAGIGTSGTAALGLGRQFILIEKERRYLECFIDAEQDRLGRAILPSWANDTDGSNDRHPIEGRRS